MEIDKELLGIWNDRLSSVHKPSMAEDIGLSVQTIYNALKGSCRHSTMVKINNFLLSNKDKELNGLNNLK